MDTVTTIYTTMPDTTAIESSHTAYKQLCDRLTTLNYGEEFNRDFQVPLFKTNVKTSFSDFLSYLPNNIRQHYNCNTCRTWFRKYAGLVFITPAGQTRSPFWHQEGPGVFKEAVAFINKVVTQAVITVPFITGEDIIGIRLMGGYVHFHTILPTWYPKSLSVPDIQDLITKACCAHQALTTALTKFNNHQLLNKGIELLRTKKLNRSEISETYLTLFKSICTKVSSTKNTRVQNNLIWMESLIAPEGVTHLANSAIGTLLKDIENELSFNSINARWNGKTAPDQYQRPQAPPSEGNIIRGNALITKYGLTKSLARKRALPEELDYIWEQPQEVSDKVVDGGVFDYLLQSGHSDYKKTRESIHIEGVPPIPITLKKFLEEIVPGAKAIAIDPSKIQTGLAFGTITSAVYPEAPPLLRWDVMENRNHLSYMIMTKKNPYNGKLFMTTPQDWNLPLNVPILVNGIVKLPSTIDVLGMGQLFSFIIPEAIYCNMGQEGSGLFPEIINLRLREVRATIEAYSNSTPLVEREGPLTNGIFMVAKGDYAIATHFSIVTKDNQALKYVVTRWE